MILSQLWWRNRIDFGFKNTLWCATGEELTRFDICSGQQDSVRGPPVLCIVL